MEKTVRLKFTLFPLLCLSTALAGCIPLYEFGQAVTPTAPSTRGTPPTACYGQYKSNPACSAVRPSFEEMKQHPDLVLTPTILQHIGWYVQNADADTSAEWELNKIVYRLTLHGDPVTDLDLKKPCRDGALKARPSKLPDSWLTYDGPFCYDKATHKWHMN